MNESTAQPMEGSGNTIKILKPTDYILKPWKNGLGQTSEIAIQPLEANFHKDIFDWRLSHSHIQNNCNFSLFPGYEVSVLLLDSPDKPGNVSLYHHDQEQPAPIKPLIPYNFAGEIPTHCKIGGIPTNVLMFMSNKKKTKVSVSVETVCRYTESGHECSEPDGTCINSLKSASAQGPGSPTNTILLGDITIMYVIKGAIKVKIEGDSEPHVLEQGSTLLCEPPNPSIPVDITMTPLIDSNKTENGNFNEEIGDATVLIIQISLLTENNHTSPLSSQTDLPRLSRGQGSVIVFDDQPMWNTPGKLTRKDSELRYV